MNTVVHLLAIPGPEELGDNDGSTGSQPGKKVDQQVDDHSGGAGDRGKCIFPDKASHNDGVDRVVKLLKKEPSKIGKKNKRSCFQMIPDVISFLEEVSFML